MRYAYIEEGVFRARPNRFVAQVEIRGQEHTVHVKNTGRCRELLIPGAKVLLEHHPDAKSQGRKTEYSLVGVYKGRMLINMDSQAPNTVAKEWLESGGFQKELGIKPENIRREVSYGQSRFDLAFTISGQPAFMEVKGVTLERDGVAFFPDAPTERGVKHLEELAQSVKDGFLAFVLFVIQMKGIREFRTNEEMHKAFADALVKARETGVKVLAYDCDVKEDGFSINKAVKFEKFSD